jgi:Fic family protein
MLFTTPVLDGSDLAVVGRIEELRQNLRYAVAGRGRWVGSLRRVSFARAVQGSNSIEGYDVSLDDAVAVAEGEEPLDATPETLAAIRGYQDAMTYVVQLADDRHFRLDENLIRSLHYMLLKYDLTRHPGRWRPGPVYVQHEATGAIVYEGPDSLLVPGLMNEFVDEYGVNSTEPVLVRAAMAHLNLVMIHPFKDGNGRMARCLQTLVLAREGILAPEFSSIEEYLGRHTRTYYDILEEVGDGSWQPERDARPWIRFNLSAHYRQARTLLRRVHEAERLWDILHQEMTRERLPERCIAGLSFASRKGRRLRRGTYRHFAIESEGSDVSDAMATRDLKSLKEKGFLIPHGEKRGRYYVATPRLEALRARVAEPRGTEDEDPYSPRS